MPKHIIIIGGGMAGLAAAGALRNCQVTLLEAKSRFGGRIHTLQTDAGVVELGAEFVHGKNKTLCDAIHAAHLGLLRVSGRNRVLQSGRLEPVEVWEIFDQLLQRIDHRANDTSFLDFLSTQSVDKRTRLLMHAFAEGFNAAHANRLSAHSLRRAGYAAEQIDGSIHARVDAGYSALIEHLVRKAHAAGARLLLETTAQIVNWRPGHVAIEAVTGDKTETFTGNAVIVALPLGVLKARGVAFHPTLPDKDEAIDGLEFGNVVKVILVFREVWPRETDFGFIYALNEKIPTWWSDARGRTLTGWAGGPKGDALVAQSNEQLELIALDILVRIFSAPVADLRAKLVSSHSYNWAQDPHVRGAYSYIPVGGLFLPKQLGAPVENTLFFAGEATAQDAQMGTVFGALESGLRAAREASG